MSRNTFFEALSDEQLKTQADSIEIAYQLIAVTLVYGDILIGSLAKYWNWNGQSVSIGFNTSQGKRLGESHLIQVHIDLIANIEMIPLSEESIPRIEENDPFLVALRKIGLEDWKTSRLVVQDYPNPLATIISTHNLQIARKYNLSTRTYMERALSTEGMPSEGIEFDEDYLLYTDWNFFSRQISSNMSVSASIPGVLSLNKDLDRSLQNEVIRRLKNSFLDQSLRGGTSSSVIKEHWLNGCIFVPDSPENTYIEGAECISLFCVSSEENGEIFPILLKLESLKYPLELLGYITSALYFYGEFLPVPRNILGTNYKRTLLIRAMGYFQNK